MKISGRYVVLGKKRQAVLDIPYETALETFEQALCFPGENSRLSGSVNHETGVFRVDYSLEEGSDEIYENYCLLVELKPLEDGYTKIEYAFVYDRLLSWYTKFLSLVCFAVPLAATMLVYFKFELRSLVHLALYIPLLLISSFGIFSLFCYREKRKNVRPMVKEFEELLINSFEE